MIIVCERCGKPRMRGYLLCHQCHIDWLKLDDGLNDVLYHICKDCGGKENDFTAYFYLEKEIHYQMRVGNSGHTDWIIKKRKQAFVFR
jgi:hypothetical protein